MRFFCGVCHLLTTFLVCAELTQGWFRAEVLLDMVTKIGDKIVPFVQEDDAKWASQYGSRQRWDVAFARIKVSCHYNNNYQQQQRSNKCHDNITAFNDADW